MMCRVFHENPKDVLLMLKSQASLQFLCQKKLANCSLEVESTNKLMSHIAWGQVIQAVFLLPDACLFTWMITRFNTPKYCLESAYALKISRLIS